MLISGSNSHPGDPSELPAGPPITQESVNHAEPICSASELALYVTYPLQGILQALFFRRQVSLHYRAVSSDETREHALCPLTLTLWRSALYLVAACEADQRHSLFAIGRIATLEPTGERFAYPPPDTYDPEECFAGAFGIFQPGKGELVLHFADDPWLHRYMKERAWHTSQSFSLRPDVLLEQRFRVRPIDEESPWARSFGDLV